MKVVVALSGGIASTVLLWRLARDTAAQLIAVTVDHDGQSPAAVKAAKRLAGCCGNVRWHKVELHGLKIGPRTPAIPGIVLAYAIEVGAQEVAFGDRDERLPDRMAVYWSGVAAVESCDRLSLRMPFADKTGADVVVLGRSLDVPLGLTWSCLRTGKKHCGACLGCRDRHTAFAAAGARDHRE